ncbi:glutamine--fructose-6-phosphate transaminase (isomerizing) [Candidatus Dependentiae bacterium]|nr:glutamine--fructose-6-phosphate transaminase (isomerizing) [Candidatus Dependentiae bacterium]
MCGVVGYVGTKLSRSFVMKGLSRLEYRGYDSAGFACLDSVSNRLMCVKAKGQLVNLTNALEESPVDGHIGIGHTRWSTHGVVSHVNAHPHVDCTETISVVHNGIIENHTQLRVQLESEGHCFRSQTDTEVVAHLFEQITKNSSLPESIAAIARQLEGAFAFSCIGEPFSDAVIAVRKGSPLCIGMGSQEMFVASDVLAFAGMTDEVVYLPDETFAIVRQSGVELYDFNGNKRELKSERVQVSWSDDGKNGYEHFMLKEIFEQKNGIHATLSYLKSIHDTVWQQMGMAADDVKKLGAISLIGAGTSWHAARIGQFFIEEICKMPARVVLASEFRYMPFFKEERNFYLAISQSGETADTLECLRLVERTGAHTVVLTNVPSSSMVRESNGFLLTKAGQEISVASTKAFSTQLAALFWLANRIALEKGMITVDQMERACDHLLMSAEILENCIEKYRKSIVDQLAPYYAQFKKWIFLGRHISYPFALEASLKLKEISYAFAQCYPAGELKHGPIALVSDDTPIIIFSTLDPLIYQKLISNAQEVKARQGHLLIFAFEGQTELLKLADNAFIIPHVDPLLGPLAMTGLMQFFVYQIANVLGCPIDKPRNLAKSVTVE